ncbi:MAG TPA: Rrf2 family transcriptional regulator [Candidatus Deferrimicrobium sp.]|nr:Rrf2 family transcriptional regulator [Candidatus Deferrimicrobium sp.]
MRISALEEYGLRCLVALARSGTEGQLSISDIARLEGLSIPYAAKLLSRLRSAGFVKAVRGRSGGFCVARDPGEISLFEVITALGGPLMAPDHCAKYTGQLDRCVHVGDCSVHNVLHGLAGYLGDLLAGASVQDLIEGKRASEDGPVVAMAIPARSLLKRHQVQKRVLSAGPKDVDRKL